MEDNQSFVKEKEKVLQPCDEIISHLPLSQRTKSKDIIELNAQIDTFNFTKKDKPFFKNLSLNLKSKELNFLIGLSGIGKTTLLKIILGILNENSNSIVEFKSNGISYSCNEAQKLGLIGFISQKPSLISWEKIDANIEMPSKLNRKLQCPSREKIIKELNSVGLDRCILNQFPHEISTGMQSRVAIVRTLLYKPKFLFLDELFTGIDTINSSLIADKLKTFIESNNAVCLSVTHDIERAVNIASKIYLLNKSQTLCQINKPFSSKNIIDIINKN